MFSGLLSWRVNTALNNMIVELRTSVCRERWSAAFVGNPAHNDPPKKEADIETFREVWEGWPKKRKACLIVSHVHKVKQGFLSLSIIYQGDLTCHWRNWSQGHTSEARTRTHTDGWPGVISQLHSPIWINIRGSPLTCLKCRWCIFNNCGKRGGKGAHNSLQIIYGNENSASESALLFWEFINSLSRSCGVTDGDFLSR